MATRRRKLTDEDKRALARVKELWADYKKKNPDVSQEVAAAKAGFGQSAFSQFLLGRVPIRLSPTVKFAKLFGVQPTEIRGDLGELAYVNTTKSGSTAKVEEPPSKYVSSEAAEIGQVFANLQPQSKATMRELLFLLSMIDRQYPWMRRGRPRGESYSAYEKRMQENMQAQITLEAQRLKR